MFKEKNSSDSLFLILEFALLVLGILLRNYWFSTGFITLMWCGIGIYGISRKKSISSALDIDNARALRGFSAIEIMLGHIGISTGNIIQYPNRKAGILFVGIFFMISGYGLAYGYSNKKAYLKTFFRRRYPAILIPAIIVIIIDAIYMHEISAPLIFEGSARWYVTELLILYLVFYVAYSFWKEKGWIFVAVISVALIIIAYAIGLSNPWYGSTLCFPLGMLYFNYTKLSNNLILAKRVCIIAGCMIITAISIVGFFVYENTFLGNVICRTLSSVSFCIALLLILEVVQIGNKYTLAISAISYEVYLLHGLFIRVGESSSAISESACFMTLFVISSSLIFATFLHGLLEMIRKKWGIG